MTALLRILLLASLAASPSRVAAQAAATPAQVPQATDSPASSSIATDSETAIRMQCEALTQQTAKEHLYGHGRLTSISEAIPSIGEYSAARTTGPDAKRYYIVTFTAPGISPRPKAIYLRGTNRQFASSPTRLEISRTYGFCYAYENERYVGINNIDTFHLLEE